MAAAVALLNFPLIALLLPAMIVVLLVALMGAGTMGSAAVVWSKIAFWLCAVLLAVLLWRLEPDWLAPLLGPGIGTLLRGSEYAAGYMAASMLSTFVMSGQAFRSRAGLAGSLMRAVVICAAAVILFSMVIPAMPQLVQTRMFRIGLLMDNGRTSLSLEIIYAFLMYGGMILAVGFDVMSASAFMRMALGKMPGWLCACVCSAAATAVALLGWAEQETMRVLAAWYYPATALACALCAIRLKRKEEPI